MKSDIREVIQSLGFQGLVRILLFPFTAVITTPMQLVRTLWRARKLILGNWYRYPHFCPLAAQTALFYWERALDLSRYGKHGISPTTGLGGYALKRQLFYCKLSLFFYWKAGAVSLLVGMFGWLFTHFLWIYDTNFAWVVSVLIISSISTIFYCQTFRRQNYNVLGWMFFPIGLYGLMTQNHFMAGLGWLICSFGSFTVVVIASFLVVTDSFVTFSFQPLMFFLPAAMKLMVHLLPLISEKSKGHTLVVIAKLIGITKLNVKYKREKLGGKKLLARVYFFLLNLQFLLVFWYLNGFFPYLFAVAILLYLLNSLLTRFTDEQSLWMTSTSIALAYTLSNQNLFLLVSLWLLISPLPLFLGFRNPKVVDIVPVYEPFDIEPLLVAMELFVEPVSTGQKIFMAFKDPGGVYNVLFDGYRANIDLLSYASAKKGILCFPDWWAVSDTNYEGAPNVWGYEPKQALNTMNYWQADYVVVYQEKSRPRIDVKWERAGFRLLTHFQWSRFAEALGPSVPKPNWWLLKPPEI